MKLAHVPIPRGDETLSSILLRLARRHAAAPHEFCAMLWPGFQFWTRDIDRTASDAILAAVSRDTGLARATLEAATLRGVVRALDFPERLHGPQRGILPVGVYHRVRRRFGQQYCPACLAEEPAYLRKLWRLEFSVACPVHGVLLRDACPACGAPFIPHRFHSMTARRCCRCDALLVAGSAGQPSPHAAMLQQVLLRALSRHLKEAAVAASHRVLPVVDWPVLAATPDRELLDGVHRLCRLASNMANRPEHPPCGSPGSWMLSRTDNRAAAMERVGRWLEAWPEAWLEWATARRLTRHFLEESYGPWPAWTGPALGRLPYALGPADYRRSRQRGFRALRRRYTSVALWREARAGLLLRRAGALGDQAE